MSATLSPFTRWALDAARTADERYMIWLICDSCRMVEHWRLQKEDPRRQFKHTPQEYYHELFLNPGLVPAFSEADTERAAAVAPELKIFPVISRSGHGQRPIRDAGALRFFPHLEQLSLGDCVVRDLSFLEALPGLRWLWLRSGVLEDLTPLRHCPELRTLYLSLTGGGHPAFEPPLYWCDASPLAALQKLESLELYPNAAVLAGMRFPALREATLTCSHTVQRDCTFLPEMPVLRHLKLEGVQSLQGIARVQSLRGLEITGPLRDWGDIAALPELKCLEVGTAAGWPRDVTPLAAAPELLWARFTGEMPRNYWPLTSSPKLCEIDVPQAKSIALEVQAINAALTPWDRIFACTPPRAVPPLRLIAADARIAPRPPETPHPDYLENRLVFHRELCWMHRRMDTMVQARGHDEHWLGRHWHPSGTECQRRLGLQIAGFSAADRLPEVIETLRQAMAGSAQEWWFSISIHLRVPRHQWGPERQRWFDMLRAGWEDDDDDGMVEKYRLTQQHLIDSTYRKRTAEEEGGEADPEDLAPPDKIRPEPYRPPVARPHDPDAEKEQDFSLKPYDEQEQNDDGDDEGEIAVDTNDDPPQWFLEDPDGHPLADNYRLYGILTFDAFYVWSNLVETAERLMGRKVDEIWPGP